MTEFGRDLRAGTKQDAFDASVGRGRQPSRVFRHQRAEAADLPDDRAPLDGVDQHRGALDGRRRRFHPRQRDRHPDNDDDADGGIAGLPEPFSLENRGVADDIRH